MSEFAILQASVVVRALLATDTFPVASRLVFLAGLHQVTATWVEFRGIADNFSIKTLQATSISATMTSAIVRGCSNVRICEADPSTPPIACANASVAKRQRYHYSAPPSSQMDFIPFGKYKGQTSSNLLNDGPYVDWIMSNDKLREWIFCNIPWLHRKLMNLERYSRASMKALGGGMNDAMPPLPNEVLQLIGDAAGPYTKQSLQLASKDLGKALVPDNVFDGDFTAIKKYTISLCSVHFNRRKLPNAHINLACGDDDREKDRHFLELLDDFWRCHTPSHKEYRSFFVSKEVVNVRLKKAENSDSTGYFRDSRNDLWFRSSNQDEFELQEERCEPLVLTFKRLESPKAVQVVLTVDDYDYYIS